MKKELLIYANNLDRKIYSLKSFINHISKERMYLWVVVWQMEFKQNIEKELSDLIKNHLKDELIKLEKDFESLWINP